MKRLTRPAPPLRCRAAANTSHIFTYEDFDGGSGALSGGGAWPLSILLYRLRAGRLCGRYSRRPARYEGRGDRKMATFGGTCLNIGCIPSKALLYASELFEDAGHSWPCGRQVSSPKLDLPAMMNHKDQGSTPTSRASTS